MTQYGLLACIIGIARKNSDHPRQLLRYFHGLLSSEDVEVRFYLGTESSSFLTDYDLVGNSYDYQYASFYSLSRFDDLDLLIVSIGTIGIFQDWATTDEILGTLPDVPRIIPASILRKAVGKNAPLGQTGGLLC